MPKKTKKNCLKVRNLVAISDTHSGCKLALCPPDGVHLDEGGTYHPSELQMKLWEFWREFWDVAVPEFTHGEPFAVLHNGDALDGVHHGATHQISNNLADQASIAHTLLQPIVERCEGRYYHIRGTEAHVGKSAQDEERLAKSLGAIPNEDGQHARYDIWIRLGQGLIHALHHIGTTGSLGFEATALNKELAELYTQSAAWGYEAPSLILRSHRHRYCETAFPTSKGKARAIVTPCWQAKTVFAWRIPGARISTPQFGGVVIRWQEDAQSLSVREYIRTVERSQNVDL